MNAVEQAARVRAAQHRIDTGHGTPEDEQILAADRLRWYGAALAADAGCDGYGTRVLPIQGGAS